MTWFIPSPLKVGRILRGKDRFPSTIFQGPNVRLVMYIVDSPLFCFYLYQGGSTSPTKELSGLSLQTNIFTDFKVQKGRKCWRTTTLGVFKTQHVFKLGGKVAKKHKTAWKINQGPKTGIHWWHQEVRRPYPASCLRFYPYKCRTKKKTDLFKWAPSFSKQQLPPSNLQHQTLQTGIVSKEFHTSKSITPPRSMNQWFVQLLGPFPKKPKTFTTILLGSGWFQPIWKILVKLDHVTK